MGHDSRYYSAPYATGHANSSHHAVPHKMGHNDTHMMGHNKSSHHPGPHMMGHGEGIPLMSHEDMPHEMVEWLEEQGWCTSINIKFINPMKKLYPHRVISTQINVWSD